MHPDSSICIICKGSRLICGLPYCPLLKKYFIESSVRNKIEKLGDSIFGPSPPNLFVGHYGWPDVRIGPLVSFSEDETNFGINDDPSKWYGKSVDEIIKFRSSLLRPMIKTNVRGKTKQVDQIQNVMLSIKPIDIEAQISGKPHLTISFSSHLQPMGPSVKMKKMKVIDNPKIPKSVDTVISEKMKAVESSQILFDKGCDVYYLTKVLSAGVLGIEKRMVPSRWSITATDDMISKYLISKIKNYDTISDYFVGSSEYMSNRFEILLMPGNWEFENFEAWAPGTLWSQGLNEPEIIEEYEGWNGRTKYSLQAGGYYASRYAATEALDSMRKQARVIVFREIGPGYQIPLGVWVVREAAKRAYRNMKRFSNFNEAFLDISSRLKNPIDSYLKMSKILTQTKLVDF